MNDFISILIVIIYVVGFPYLVRFIGRKLLKVINKIRGVISDLSRRTKRGLQSTKENISVIEVQEGISEE